MGKIKKHVSKGPENPFCINNYRIKEKQGQSMMEYINSFVDKIEQLEDIGIKLPEELTSIIILNLLSTDYENFCSSTFL